MLQGDSSLLSFRARVAAVAAGSFAAQSRYIKLQLLYGPAAADRFALLSRRAHLLTASEASWQWVDLRQGSTDEGLPLACWSFCVRRGLFKFLDLHRLRPRSASISCGCAITSEKTLTSELRVDGGSRWLEVFSAPLLGLSFDVSFDVSSPLLLSMHVTVTGKSRL